MTDPLRLPNFNEFSPTIVGSVRSALRVVAPHEGNREGMVGAAATFPLIQATHEGQRLNRANNVLIGMSQCGLLDKATHTLTPLGKHLAEMSSDDESAREFAKHLLAQHHGFDVLDSVRAVQKRGETATKATLAEEMRHRGFYLTTNAVDPGKLRLWLEQAGIINSAWLIDESELQRLVGLGTESVSELMSLYRPQRVLLETVRDLARGSDGWLDVAHAKQLCQVRHPGILPESTLRAAVLDPLEAQGWIETRGKARGGRGGKAGELRPLAKLLDVSLDDLPESTVDLPPELLRLQNTPLEKIYRDLDSSDTHEKGIALELLSLRLMRDLGLRPVRFRERAQDTGGGEVDLIVDGVHLHYSRWLCQCKNTPSSSVRVEALAKEIGMAVLLQAQVVVLVTRGKFTKPVYEQAHQLAATSPLQVVLIDGKLLESYRSRGALAVIDHLQNCAAATLIAKQPQISKVDS